MVELVDKSLAVLYTNYRGETAIRMIVPQVETLRWDSTEYHPEKQWLFDCFDLDRQAIRTYALADCKFVGQHGNWLDRLNQEARDLEDKVEKLRSFIENRDAFTALTAEDQALLMNQFAVMTSYAGILTQRLQRARESVSENT